MTFYSRFVNMVDGINLNLKQMVQEIPLGKIDENVTLNKKSLYLSNKKRGVFFGYNDPPIGPIDKGFECTICENSGPSNHKKTCQDPFRTSLVLEETGVPFNNIPKNVLKQMGIKTRVSDKKGINNVGYKNDVFLTFGYKNYNPLVHISPNGLIYIVKAPIELLNKFDQIIIRVLNKVLDDKINYDPSKSKTTMITSTKRFIPKNSLDIFDMGKLDLLLDRPRFFDFSIRNYEYISDQNLARSKRSSISFTMTIPDQPFKVSLSLYKQGGIQIYLSTCTRKNILKHLCDIEDKTYDLTMNQVNGILNQLFEILNKNHKTIIIRPSQKKSLIHELSKKSKKQLVDCIHSHSEPKKKAPKTTIPKTSKKCKEDQVLNPHTNRCIKKGGAVYKKVFN